MASKNIKSDFLAKLKAQKGVEDAVKKAAAARDENAPADIPDGTYTLRGKKIQTYSKDNQPIVKLVFEIARGPHKGTPIAKKFYLAAMPPKNGKPGISMAEVMERYSVFFQGMGYDPDSFADGLAAIPASLEWFEDESPLFSASISTKGQYQNVYSRKPITDEEEEGGEDDEKGSSDPDDDVPTNDDETPEPEASDEGDSDDGESSDTSEASADDDEPVVIAVRDQVFYKPMGEKKKVECVVIKSDDKKRVATMRNTKTKAEYKNIPWDAIEPIYE